ncbi:hypothetical protein J2W97_001139 [Paenibacillus jamilae]|nr:hypothetical protein [Paenibacillus jamilae]
MKLCVNCNNSLEDESLYCNKCGAKQELGDTSDNTGENLVAELPKDNSPKKKLLTPRKIVYGVALILFLVISAITVYFNTPEQKAKATVDNYLNALQHGKYVGGFKSGSFDDYANVLDYKYVNTRHGLSYDGKDILTFDLDSYNESEERFSSDLEEYLQKMKDLYLNDKNYTLIESNSEKLVIRDNKVGHSFSFLYDMQVTNGLGTPVYKKVTFDVDNFSGEYKISYYFDK